MWLLVWLPLTLVLDVMQFLLSPCSGMPILSLLFGVPTFGAVVALPIVLVENWKDDSRRPITKVALSLVQIVALSAIVCLAGIILLFTHIAP
jgi:hypothetical protein